MDLLIGIDLGTSSVRGVIVDTSGRVAACAQREYPIDTPRPGWAEQAPERWWQATVEAIQEALAQTPSARERVAAISFSGQMHGTVVLGKTGAPLRPAIIWADQRAGEQCRRIEETVGRDTLAEATLNPVASGFMAASLKWLQEREPRVLADAGHVLLPKDYVRYRLTGHLASEPSDACSTLLFDARRREWAWEIIAALGLPQAVFPPIVASDAVVSEITREAADATGLRPGTPVVAGGGDQPVAALANAAIDPGVLLSTIGTGGQLFTPAIEPRFDPKLRTHTFCHVVPARWYLMGASLCAGLSLRWLRDEVLGGRMDYAALSAQAANVPPGAEGLIFLPYLVGERTPHMDPRARGSFVGLTLRHGAGHMARAIMEGVSFAMRDSLEIFRGLGLRFDRAIASGGGARSEVWRQIQADVYGLPVHTVDVAEQAGVGAAMLAGVGLEMYKGAADAVARVVATAPSADPHSGRVGFYRERYDLFRELYPALKDVFHRLSE